MRLRGVLCGLGLVSGSAAAVLLLNALSSAPPFAQPKQHCRSSGARHLAPPLSEAEACARFMTRIVAVPGVTQVELTILPQGLLKAVVTRAGTRGTQNDFALAVMDRALFLTDLDQLAANTVNGLQAVAW
jgi:hypothetical protein